MTETNDTPTTPEQLAVIIESLLFVADHAVAISDLVKTLDASQRQVEQGLTILDNLYQTRGLRLQRNGSKVQLVTASDMSGYVEKFLGLSISSKLSTAALEALGIVAYRQPITRPEIEAIRGVNCDGVLRTLLSKGLIEEVGRLNTVGHPIQYGTTFEFLQYFGLASLEELPALTMELEEADESSLDLAIEGELPA